MLWLDTSRTTSSPGSSRFLKWRQDNGNTPGEGIGDTPSCKPFRYVLSQRVWFFGLFDLKTGLHFAHFGLVSDMVFERTTGVYERIYNEQEWNRNMRIRNAFERNFLFSLWSKYWWHINFCLKARSENGHFLVWNRVRPEPDGTPPTKNSQEYPRVATPTGKSFVTYDLMKTRLLESMVLITVGNSDLQTSKLSLAMV